MIKKLNYFGNNRTPCFFIISFDKSKFYIESLENIDKDIKFSLNKQTFKNSSKIKYSSKTIELKRYKKAFEKVQQHIKRGNSYLLNLTFPSELFIDKDLKTIYEMSSAKFKLYFKDIFVCFSPERFIKIKNNTIYTYPMKGTIDASTKNAKQKILSNQKEMAEHTMIVDLLRNDLNMVSKNVKVEKFRFVEKILAGEKELLQVSSKISGKLEDNWQNSLGNILNKMLPAGSITGTPKRKTIQIIKEVENYDRGWFSGVFGIFDGESLDSSVMIRFIQKQDDRFFYKSGGGITIDSDLLSEYNELKEKVYVPVF